MEHIVMIGSSSLWGVDFAATPCVCVCVCAGASDGSTVRPFEVLQEMGHQLANMAMLYVLIGLLNKRARKAGNNAARQV